jgi:hypothetical protein
VRTHDGGQSWQEIVKGIPQNENVNAVREDPERKGLLFVSTERAVYVSFDDGDNWQSLRLNMPASSVRDIIVHGDDLAAATHGRGFWILDNITPLRQTSILMQRPGGDSPFLPPLLKPQKAVRVRWDMNPDTPLPPDFPAGENPPDGAMIDYNLPSSVKGPVVLEIKDSKGTVVRRYSSAEPVGKIDPAKLQIPAYWVREPKGLSAEPGLHRFLWDMHYAPVPGIDPGYPISAIPHNTAPDPTAPWVMPGNYTVVLTVNGHSESQPLTVIMDPRVKTPEADLARQFTLSKQLYDQAVPLAAAAAEANSIREQLDAVKKQAGQGGAASGPIADFEKKLIAIAGGAGGARFAAAAAAPQKTLASVRGQLLALMRILQEADVAPTQQAQQAAVEPIAAVPGLVQNWQQFKQQELPALNQQLKSAGLPEVNLKKQGTPEEMEGDEE